MRGIADSAYALKFMWGLGPRRGIQLYLQLLEAHLLPFLVINTMVFFPAYYTAVLGLPAGSRTSDLVFIEKIGQTTIVFAIIILICYEFIRNLTCRQLFNKSPAYKLWHFPSYLLLLVAATPFMILPTIYVAVKHLFNISSLNYHTAAKGSSGGRISV